MTTIHVSHFAYLVFYSVQNGRFMLIYYFHELFTDTFDLANVAHNLLEIAADVFDIGAFAYTLISLGFEVKECFCEFLWLPLVF